MAWRRNFSRRLHVAALFAHLFMRPVSTRIATTLLERFPQLLTEGARWSGKAEPLRGARHSTRRGHERQCRSARCPLPPPMPIEPSRRTSMTTLQSVQAMLQANFDLAPEVLQPEAKLEDLAIDSLSVIEVLFALEDEFKVTVPSEPAALQTRMKTVGDLVAYVDKLVAEQHPAMAGGEVTS